MIFHTIRGIAFFPLREVPNMTRDAIEENHALIQKSPFYVRNCLNILATPLIGTNFSRAVRNW